MPYTNRATRNYNYRPTAPYYEGDEGAGYNGFLRDSAKVLGESLLEGKDIDDAYAEVAKFHGIKYSDFRGIKAAAEQARRAQLVFDVKLCVARAAAPDADAIEFAARCFNMSEEEILEIVDGDKED